MEIDSLSTQNRSLTRRHASSAGLFRNIATRLLNVHSRRLEEYIGDRIPPYAILSHTWGDSEVTFQDLAKPDHAIKPAYAKIEGGCQQAIRDGHDYVWIDTCCIDKSSSAELSEAINSMHKWYKDSQVCYVCLADVSAFDIPFDEGFAICIPALLAAWKPPSQVFRHLSPSNKHSVKQIYLRDLPSTYGFGFRITSSPRKNVHVVEYSTLRWGVLLFRKPTHAFIVGIQFRSGALISAGFAFGIDEVDEATTLEYILKEATVVKLPNAIPVPEKHVLDFEEVDEDGSTQVKRCISLEGHPPNAEECPGGKLSILYGNK
ncbi:hypothetical protein DL766_001933 [Monosporascus sp. MC13-8B]|uniref:Heterokaryon incompatibility domain-containing protein n=1 Tax=Monosporascus cannonballus TaxID=155416 RepID=A0ABY0HMU0_9PEZI|nr:hypothetical protein DL762_000461 [Monosporascus cannonballus]RYO96154.1 hypothetical protein DL763_003355 [Monosporascus cannonballus]RYP36557.1 hypothetical protein DL766_001933 [Monosporascus sp. MC13-8B]